MTDVASQNLKNLTNLRKGQITKKSIQMNLLSEKVSLKIFLVLIDIRRRTCAMGSESRDWRFWVQVKHL